MGKIIGIIPARWGSTRFPGKPLHPIAGKPLIQRVWERCRQARRLDGVVIATDDMRIAEAAFAFGAEVALTSPDCQSGTDRAAEVAVRLGKNVSHVINIQGDEPAIAPALIDELAAALKKNRRLQMITAANELRDFSEAQNPNCVKVTLAKNGDALYFSRSVIPYPLGADAADVTYYRHQGIYGYRKDFLAKFVRWKPSVYEKIERLEQLRALEHGVAIRVLLTGHESFGVDSPEDVSRMEARLADLE
jgi:3-deoxy-manno-octulosonate cytidylyltransferase (CMP-KDO synthetase)